MNTGNRHAPPGLVVETVSPAELFEVISGCAAQDPARIQASSTRLKAMLEMSGTYDGLHEIAAQKTLPLAIRQQSLIQFKNAALNHWKSRKLLSEEQRIRIRARCLTFIDEQDDIIAQFNELIVGRLARHDFPATWPTLVDDLMAIITTNLQARYSSPTEDPRSTLTLRRTLKLLNSVIKELASMKMLSGVQTMAQVVTRLHTVFRAYYSEMSPNFASPAIPIQNFSLPRTVDEITLAHLVYKCLGKMASWTWHRIDKISKEEYAANQAWLQELFSNSTLQLKTLVHIRGTLIMSLTGQADPCARRSVDILTRHIRTFGKFFRRLQRLSHARFAALNMCSDLILYYWDQVVGATSGPSEMIADSGEALYPVRFLVQGMVLFKESLSQWTVVRKDGTLNANSLSQDFVENAVRLLVTRFMPLNAADLDGWMADPEEWVNMEDKENDQWEFELRACSERVLMQLCNQYTQFVTPLLELMFKQVVSQPTIDLSSIIQKEALYCAIGRCALRLKNQIPFDQWLEQHLAVEAREDNPSYPIIKRRIAWLIGKWIGDECSPATNPKIWEVLVHLLKDRGQGTDVVVRLTAAIALRECVDTNSFDVNIFAPFLPIAVTELVRIVGEADTLESKRRVSSTLNSIIERAETRIVPFVGIITQPLPQLWTTAGEDWLFKASLLITVTKVIESIKDQSSSLGGIVVPLLRESLTKPTFDFLDMDALCLWVAALRNTVTIESVQGAPALFELFPTAVSMLDNLDVLGKVTSVLQSYLLLNASAILQAYAVDLFRAILAVLTSQAVTLNMKDTLVSLGLLLQVAPPSLWAEAMHVSGLFAHLLKLLIDGESKTLLLAETICVFARMVMADRQMFLQLMSATASSQNTTETYLFENLLDQWWGKFDNMSEPRSRKLCAMGIASLVSTGRPEVLQRLPGEIFNIWMDVFGEIKEARLRDNEDGSSPVPGDLRRFWERDDAPVDYYQGTEGTPEYARRKTIWDNDPVRTMQLSSYVGSCLREAEATCGSEVFQATYLSKADPIVFKEIQKELSR